MDLPRVLLARRSVIVGAAALAVSIFGSPAVRSRGATATVVTDLPAAVEERITEERLVDLARQLIEVRSDYDEGVVANHEEMAALLAEQLRGLGMKVEVVEPTGGYPTVIGRLSGTRGGPTLGMLAHYNTVTPGDLSKWETDPFTAVVRGDRIYGLGASDQKTAIAATLVATRAILDAGIELGGDLVHLYIPGEGAQVHSLPFIVEEQPELLAADWYIDTEGGPDIVKISGGWTWVKVRVEGVGAHTGAARPDGKPGRPVNAIYRMAHVLTQLENVDNWMTYEEHPLFQRPLYDNKPIVEVGKIEGGYKVNQVPDWAEAQLDIRLLPGQSPDGVLEEMRVLFRRLREEDPELVLSVEPMTTQWVPLHEWEKLDDDDPLIQAIRRAAPKYLGRVPGWTGSIGGGRPDLWAVGAKWVNFGMEGTGGNAHAPNEYANIEASLQRARLYAEIMLEVLE